MATDTQKSLELPPVSIIILTFNGADYILPLLQSLTEQTYPADAMEIIVTDNASADDTVHLVRNHHPSVKLVQLESNLGFAAGNNQGLLHASHDLLVFLNQDTVCHPAFLKSLVKVMHEDCDIAACNPNIVTPSPPVLEAVDMSVVPPSLYVCDMSPYGYGRNRTVNGRRLIYPRLLSGCAFIIRRKAIKKLGYLFDDRLWMYAEDSDLSLRLHNSGLRIAAARDSIVYHLHRSNPQLTGPRLRLAARAIMNRVFIFSKNMHGWEFIVFLPFLVLGGIFKIREFSLPAQKKAIFFLPFGLFSITCMLLALFRLPQYAAAGRFRLVHGRRSGFSLLKLTLISKT
jgi:GT2 family glycosyltransferase